MQRPGEKGGGLRGCSRVVKRQDWPKGRREGKGHIIKDLKSRIKELRSYSKSSGGFSVQGAGVRGLSGPMVGFTF